MKNEEYVFYNGYHQKLVVTNENITYSDSVIKHDDIINISLSLISIRYTSLEYIRIETNCNFFKIDIPLHHLEENKKLFSVINELYADKMDKKLDYDRHEKFRKNKKQAEKFRSYILIASIGSFVLFMLYILIYKMLETFPTEVFSSFYKLI